MNLDTAQGFGVSLGVLCQVAARMNGDVVGAVSGWDAIETYSR